MTTAELNEILKNGHTAAEMKRELDEREQDKELQRHPAQSNWGHNHD